MNLFYFLFYFFLVFFLFQQGGEFYWSYFDARSWALAAWPSSFQTHRQHFTLNQPTQNLKNISLYILRSKTNILCKVFMNNEGLLLKRTSQNLQMLKRTTNAKRKWKFRGMPNLYLDANNLANNWLFPES